MSLAIQTQECYPKALNVLGIGDVPAPWPDHESCPKGQHQPGVIGGWHCPCPCHHTTPNGSSGASDPSS